MGGWLSRAEEIVVLLKVFSDVYDLGSLLNDRKIYDHILSRFTEKEYHRLGKSTENNREPFMLLGNVKMCSSDRVDALQAEMQSNPNKFKQSPTCSFADRLEANATRYRAHHPRRLLTVELYETLFGPTHRLDSRNLPFRQALFQLLKQHGALPPTATERDFSSVDFQQLIRCCHELDTTEAEQRASHPSDDSRSKLSLLHQRISALDRASKTDNRRSSIAAAAANKPVGSNGTHPRANLMHLLGLLTPPLWLLTHPMQPL